MDADQVVEALVGDLDAEPGDPLANPVTGPRGELPTNLSGGLKARGHPVGGTGLFQIAENYLQITGAFPNPRAQVPDARMGPCHSIGGPGNNVYVTLLESSDSDRSPEPVPRPETSTQSLSSPWQRGQRRLGGKRRWPQPPQRCITRRSSRAACQ